MKKRDQNDVTGQEVSRKILNQLELDESKSALLQECKAKTARTDTRNFPFETLCTVDLRLTTSSRKKPVFHLPGVDIQLFL